MRHSSGKSFVLAIKYDKSNDEIVQVAQFLLRHLLKDQMYIILIFLISELS